MVDAGIFLTNSAVNSGVAVELVGATVNYKWINIIGQKPIPGKNDLVEADQFGFENPLIVISGVIDVDTLPANNTGSGAELSEQYLKQFASAQTTDNVLTIGVGENTIGITDFSGNAGDINIKVVIKSFNFTFGADSERGHLLKYSINLAETA